MYSIEFLTHPTPALSHFLRRKSGFRTDLRAKRTHVRRRRSRCKPRASQSAHAAEPTQTSGRVVAKYFGIN